MDEVKPDKPYSAKTFLENLPTLPSKEMDGMPLSDVDMEVKTLLSLGEAALMGYELDDALKLFDRAIELKPFSAPLYLRQGKALLSFGQEEGNEKTLLIACKKFKTAIQVEPDNISALWLWGTTLYLLGTIYNEKHYYISSLEKLNAANALSAKLEPMEKGDLFWDIAKAKYKLSTFSTEPIDWQEAIGYFNKSQELASSRPAIFWDEYGACCLELYNCMGDIKLLVRSIQYFKAALTTGNHAHHQGWKHLARALTMLYRHTHDEEHFTQASSCFNAAENIFPADISLLIDHADLLLESARLFYEEKKGLLALEKCHKACLIEPSNTQITSLWAEALCLLGEKGDKLDLLLEGQSKVELLEEEIADNPAIYLSHGRCLCSLARYFDDIDLYYLASEKFQAGLSLNRTLATHWHAMAMSYYEIATIAHDTELLEKAIKFLSKALDISPRSSLFSLDLSLCMMRLGEFKACPSWLEKAIEQFEKTLQMQKNAYYIHLDWLFQYAKTLDLLGDFYDEESYYAKAIELLAHVLIVSPSFKGAHHQMGLSFCHLAQLTHHMDHFFKALQHLKVAAKHDEDSDLLYVDQAITLIHIALLSFDSSERQIHLADAEMKLIAAAKGGCLLAYYQLACLYSIQENYILSLHYLEKAEKYSALPPLEEILEDDWLDGVKSTPEWKDFFLKIEKIKKSQ